MLTKKLYFFSLRQPELTLKHGTNHSCKTWACLSSWRQCLWRKRGFMCANTPGSCCTSPHVSACQALCFMEECEASIPPFLSFGWSSEASVEVSWVTQPQQAFYQVNWHYLGKTTSPQLCPSAYRNSMGTGCADDTGRRRSHQRREVISPVLSYPMLFPHADTASHVLAPTCCPCPMS